MLDLWVCHTAPRHCQLEIRVRLYHGSIPVTTLKRLESAYKAIGATYQQKRPPAVCLLPGSTISETQRLATGPSQDTLLRNEQACCELSLMRGLFEA